MPLCQRGRPLQHSAVVLVGSLHEAFRLHGGSENDKVTGLISQLFVFHL